MVQRLSVVGLIIAIVVAILALFGQQEAVKQANVALTAQSEADNQRAMAVEVAEQASTAQAQAQIGEATAVQQAQQAMTAQAEADEQRMAAVEVAEQAATAQTQAQTGEATAVQQSELAMTAQAEAFNLASTAQAQVLAMGTALALGEPAKSDSLSETYNADGISFNYPGGWVIELPDAPGGPIIIANNQATLDAAQSNEATAIAPGQQFIIVLPFIGETFQALRSVITSPLDLLTQIGSSMSGDEMKFGTPTEATVAGNPAALMLGSGITGEAHIIAIGFEDSGYVMVMGGAAKGEMDNLEVILNAVAATITVTPPAA